ncbi:MAG: ABC transporter permease, partial [Cetobacterium sp.]
GGASVRKASIFNVIVGTVLFQGVITMTPIVISGLIKTDMSETIRVIISNGMIIYALTRKGGER